MQRFDNNIHTLNGVLALLTVLLLSGCATSVSQPTEARAEPSIAVLPPLAEVPVSPPRKPRPLPTIPTQPDSAPEPVTVLVSGSQPAYMDVARELLLRYDDAALFDLDDNAAVSVLNRINDGGTSAVVAIGLRAARAAVALADAPVVFSQVFNYHEYPLLTAESRGVAAYAPLDLQLSQWQAMDPNLARVGMIIGDGHDELIAEARRAASASGIELAVHVSASDQETLYAFRRMSREIDGFWLFPDNRVLSARSLREITRVAERQRVRIAVQNDGLLAMGASLSLSSVASDIADVIVSVVSRIQAGELDDVPQLSLLREVSVTTGSPALVLVQAQ